MGEEAVLRTDSGAIWLVNDIPVRTEGEGELDLALAVIMRLYLEAWQEEEIPSWLPPR